MSNIQNLYDELSKKITIDNVEKSLSEERGKGRGVRGSVQKDGGADYCLCIGCGYTKKHSQGIPCRDNPCPKCGGPFVGASAEEVEELKAKYTEKKVTPKKSVEKCSTKVEKKKKIKKDKLKTESTHQCMSCGKVYDSLDSPCPICKSNDTEILFNESEAVTEQDYKTIARGIENEEDAEKLAAEKKGTVIQDEEDEKKFAVVVKEAFLDLDLSGSADIFIARADVSGSSNIITTKADITYMLDIDYKSWGIESIHPVFTAPVLITYEGSEGIATEMEVDLSDGDIDWIAGKDYSPDSISLQIVNDKVIEVSVTFNYYVP